MAVRRGRKSSALRAAEQAGALALAPQCVILDERLHLQETSLTHLKHQHLPRRPMWGLGVNTQFSEQCLAHQRCSESGGAHPISQGCSPHLSGMNPPSSSLLLGPVLHASWAGEHPSHGQTCPTSPVTSTHRLQVRHLQTAHTQHGEASPPTPQLRTDI